MVKEAKLKVVGPELETCKGYKKSILRREKKMFQGGVRTKVPW